MGALPRLPKPPRGQRAQFVLSGLLLGPMMITVAVLMVGDGDPLLAAAGVAMLLGTSCGCGYIVRFVMTPHGKHHVELEGKATVLPESQVARSLAWVAAAGAFAFLAVLVLLAARASPTGVPQGVNAWWWVFLLAFATPTAVAALAGRRPRGALVLTPEVVRLRTWSSEREVDWDDVVEVVALREPRRTLAVYVDDSDQVRVLRAPGGLGEHSSWPIPGHDCALAISFPHLTGDPAVLLAALDHWRRVRRDRAELGTEASLRRLDPGTP